MQTIVTLKRYNEARKVTLTYHQHAQAIGLNTDELVKQFLLEALGAHGSCGGNVTFFFDNIGAGGG